MIDKNIVEMDTKLSNKYINFNIETYLLENISKTFEPETKLHKLDENISYIPKIDDYKSLLKYNYNIKQLKQISKEYGLKCTGNKQQLVFRIYSFLYLSNKVIKIQKITRGFFQRKYNTILHSPGFKDRTLCTNTIDFLSMDELTNISDQQFFSFKDDDGFIYGFEILSFYNLLNKCDGVIKNPYNTKPLSSNVIDNFRLLLNLGRFLNINILTEISDITKEVSYEKSTEFRALTVFQNINALGNYSDSKWFLMLNKIDLIKFICELTDIWNFRCNLSNETKKEICPPYGFPFVRIHYNRLNAYENIDDLRNLILGVIESLVNKGINKDSKSLGAYYILGALTLVNNDAATSMPWLYQALCYM